MRPTNGRSTSTTTFTPQRVQPFPPKPLLPRLPAPRVSGGRPPAVVVGRSGPGRRVAVPVGVGRSGAAWRFFVAACPGPCFLICSTDGREGEPPRSDTGSAAHATAPRTTGAGTPDDRTEGGRPDRTRQTGPGRAADGDPRPEPQTYHPNPGRGGRRTERKAGA